MFETEYDGQRIRLKGKHPHAGETGTILGAEKTIAGTGYLIQLDNAGKCFVFNPDAEAELLRGE